MSAIGAQPVDAGNVTALEERPRTLWRDAWSRLRVNKTVLVCAGILAIYVLVALIGFTGVLNRPGKDNASLITREYGGPNDFPAFHGDSGKISPALWFGTDFLGRSVFWRFIYGVRVALTVAVLASLIEIVIGVTLGAVAGYFGGWVDAVIVWLFSTVSSVPWILMMVALAYVLQGRTIPARWEKWFDSSADAVLPMAGIPSIVLALGLTTWVGLCRLVRGEVLKHRSRDYVAAARAMGLSHLRIIFRHILPNVFHLVIISFCVGLGGFVQIEVVLSFLGLGVTEVPSWGRMIDDAKLELLKGVWWQMAAATAAIFVFSLAVNLFGDALRDALDPRLRGTD